jgi:hypothetical protein
MSKDFVLSLASTEWMASLNDRARLSHCPCAPYWGIQFQSQPGSTSPQPQPAGREPQEANTDVYNIAHRGSNGELPEETAAAYLVTTVNSCFSQQPTSTFLFSE